MKNLKRLSRLLRGSISTDAQTRYEAQFDLVAALADTLSFRLYNKNLRWYRDPAGEFTGTWSGFPEATPYIHDRKFNLFGLARAIRNVPGDSAECGTFRGASSFLILSAFAGTGKHHHIFDSFEGLSRPRAEDDVQQDRTFRWQPHDLAVNEQDVRANLSRFDNVHYYAGWIPVRFDDVKDRRFSLVHIDVDLYQPTKDSMDFFYPRMSPGGMLICDDYGSEACPGAYQAVNDAMAGKPEGIAHLTTGQALIIKQ